MTEASPLLIPGESAREQASYWFAHRAQIASDQATRQRFEQWRGADAEHDAAYAELEALWNNRAFEQALQSLEVDLGLPPAPVQRSWRRPMRQYLATAAAVLLMLGAGWMADVPMRLQAEHLTAIAQVEHLELADGSHIVLGSNSAISTAFDGQSRHIRLLRGDLYIEAFHDAARPLIIDTGEARVTVVGTRFSVSKRDKQVTVAVREGRVRFANNAGDNNLLLVGNWQQLKAGHLQPAHQEGGERQMAWINGRLSFQDAPLADVLSELRRYYPAPILLFNSTAATQRVSGNYQLDEPLAIVQALSKVTATQVTRLPGGTLVVR
ncbi:MULTISPECIES: FecR family protein [Pseudomonas]|uniref:FecR family protein n=1 Tax=Pseudomonas TaxID=286 RepID=UPI000C2AF83F|nr:MULTISPECIES: FecR family protein [Pseudomonas]PJY97241.1 iron dicitrate transport regulator FecR [Pseudomonas donghuensis]QHF27045.1 iron dicitrate transport regulator FecR [Pseudomonas sp. R32]WKY29226.1 FecR family protein [Pseudomonas donghuensis]